MIDYFEEYKKNIKEVLKDLNLYNNAMDFQIEALASALVQHRIATEEIEKLESTTIEEKTRENHIHIVPHPVFSILRSSQDSITKQIKSLGLDCNGIKKAITYYKK